MIGVLGTTQGKIIEVHTDRMVVKSPTYRVECRLPLDPDEMQKLANLLLESVQIELGQADHNDEVVT